MAAVRCGWRSSLPPQGWRRWRELQERYKIFELSVDSDNHERRCTSRRASFQPHHGYAFPNSGIRHTSASGSGTYGASQACVWTQQVGVCWPLYLADSVSSDRVNHVSTLAGKSAVGKNPESNSFCCQHRNSVGLLCCPPRWQLVRRLCQRQGRCAGSRHSFW